MKSVKESQYTSWLVGLLLSTPALLFSAWDPLNSPGSGELLSVCRGPEASSV